MLKRDFILVQIEELGKVIARIISQRNMNTARTNPGLIQSVYRSLKLDRDYLISHSAEAILHLLNGEDMAGLQRMELAAKLLLEDSYEDTSQQQVMRLKANELLTYIQEHDNTFSMERVRMLEEIQLLLNNS